MMVVFTHTVAGYSQIGGYAVNVFFALSGFLILEILFRLRLKMEQTGRSFGASLADFWLKRAARILPAYYVIGGVVVVLLIGAGSLSSIQSLAYIFYVQNIAMGVSGHWWPFGYSWTLGVEQQFYIAAAPIMLLIPSRHHASVLFATAIILLVSICGMLIFTDVSPFLIFMLPLFGFVLAGIGGYASIRRAEGHSIRIPSPVVIAIIVVIALAAPLPASFMDLHPTINIIQVAFEAFGLPALIAYIAVYQQSYLVRLLEHPLLRFLGLISYSLYLIHGYVAETLKAHWPAFNLGSRYVNLAAERASLFFVVTLISVALAWLSWRFIEMVFRRRHRKVTLVDRASGPAA